MKVSPPSIFCFVISIAKTEVILRKQITDCDVRVRVLFKVNFDECNVRYFVV